MDTRAVTNLQPRTMMVRTRQEVGRWWGRATHVVLPPGSRRSHVVADTGDALTRRMDDMVHSWRGVAHHLRGGPPPDASDHVLADRVRSTIGPLEKELDIPHVHVMAESGTVLLHGDVPGPSERRAVEVAVGLVPGVEHVESHLHEGLLPSDTRPSQGRAAAAATER